MGKIILKIDVRTESQFQTDPFFGPFSSRENLKLKNRWSGKGFKLVVVANIVVTLGTQASEAIATWFDKCEKRKGQDLVLIRPPLGKTLKIAICAKLNCTLSLQLQNLHSCTFTVQWVRSNG